MSAPIVKTYEYPVAMIKEILTQDAIRQFEAPVLDEEGKDQREPTTIQTVTVENRAGGDKLVHILYREGNQSYGD